MSASLPYPLPTGKRRRLLTDVIEGNVSVEQYVDYVKREVDELLASLLAARAEITP